MNTKQEAQDILNDIKLEREMWEIANISDEDALLTIETYGYEGQELLDITSFFLQLIRK